MTTLQPPPPDVRLSFLSVLIWAFLIELGGPGLEPDPLWNEKSCRDTDFSSSSCYKSIDYALSRLQVQNIEIMRSRKARKPDDPNQKKLLIGDDLLIEILSRIPTPVVAIRCKLVCKGWCSLISSPYFISRFKQQHIKHPKPLSGMLANTLRRLDIAEDSDFNFRGFNLDYLPVKYGNIMVVAYCNDLIVIEAQPNGCRVPNYYLCNPFTVQWVPLPRPQKSFRPRTLFDIRTGLVCNNGGDRIQYRIVRFYATHGMEIRFNVEMYCSEASRWVVHYDLGKDFFIRSSSVAAYNGKLHWLNEDGEYLVTFDPFNMRHTSLRLINSPNSDCLWWSRHCHVGEIEGVLRVIRFQLQPRSRNDEQTISKGISVWELQEDEDATTRRLIFKEFIVLKEGKDQKCGGSGLGGIQKVALHPSNRDVLFLEIGGLLTSFDTKTSKLTVETRFKGGYGDRYAFTIQLPWWPTPIQ